MVFVEPNDEIRCTSLDRDWGDDRPNMLMHPPCACPRCAPDAVPEDDTRWLKIAGSEQRRRVEVAELGATGKSVLG
jgi:hypothetical protein